VTLFPSYVKAYVQLPEMEPVKNWSFEDRTYGPPYYEYGGVFLSEHWEDNVANQTSLPLQITISTTLTRPMIIKAHIPQVVLVRCG
jgi:hypothetical protein